MQELLNIDKGCQNVCRPTVFILERAARHSDWLASSGDATKVSSLLPSGALPF